MALRLERALFIARLISSLQHAAASIVLSQPATAVAMSSLLTMIISSRLRAISIDKEAKMKMPLGRNYYAKDTLADEDIITLLIFIYIHYIFRAYGFMVRKWSRRLKFLVAGATTTTFS